jgi:hypothetical protein
MSRGLVNNMLTMNNLGDGSTLSLDFTTMGGVLDPRLTFTRASTVATYVNSSGYVATATTNEPRFDYSPTNIGEPRGLLIEGSAINYLPYSNSFIVSAGWTGRINLNTTAWTGFTAPDQSTNAVRLVPNTTNGAHRIEHSDVAGLSNNTQYTVSVWCKPDGYSRLGITASNSNARRNFAPASNASTGYGTSSTATITAFAGGWYRVTMTFTTGAANTPFGVWLSVHNVDEDPITSWEGNNTDGMQVWGVQVEAGSGASSYIPTGASQVTRNPDLLAVTSTTTMGLNTSEGTFFVETELPRAGTTSPSQFGAPYANGSWLGQFYGGTEATTLTANWWGGSGLPLSRSGNPKSLTALSYGLYTGTSIPVSSSLNGAVVTGTFTTSGANNAPNPATWNFITLACNASSLVTTSRDNLNACIKKFKYFPTRLSNAQLQTLTTP